MSSGYGYTKASLYEAISVAEENATAIRQALTKLDTDVQRTLATWTGDAKGAYVAAKAKWDQAAASMPASLAQARVTLENIAETYETAEQRAQATFS